MKARKSYQDHTFQVQVYIVWVLPHFPLFLKNYLVEDTNKQIAFVDSTNTEKNH